MFSDRTRSRTHQLILIGGDRGEDRLREYESLVLLLLKIGDMEIVVVGLPATDQMYPRLVSVHRVQHDLKIENRRSWRERHTVDRQPDVPESRVRLIGSLSHVRIPMIYAVLIREFPGNNRERRINPVPRTLTGDDGL